jgi:hypothetical protein
VQKRRFPFFYNVYKKLFPYVFSLRLENICEKHKKYISKKQKQHFAERVRFDFS